MIAYHPKQYQIQRLREKVRRKKGWMTVKLLALHQATQGNTHLMDYMRLMTQRMQTATNITHKTGQIQAVMEEVN